MTSETQTENEVEAPFRLQNLKGTYGNYKFSLNIAFFLLIDEGNNSLAQSKT
jgi:hypothetical protein